jgi:hypothetical protein
VFETPPARSERIQDAGQLTEALTRTHLFSTVVHRNSYQGIGHTFVQLLPAVVFGLIASRKRFESARRTNESPLEGSQL